MKDLLNNVGIKKILAIIGIIVGVIVLIIFCLLMYNNFFTKSTYSSIENEMTSAAKDYYNENPKLLPQTAGGIVTVNVNTLVANGHMKELAEYMKKIDSTVSCTGVVTVTETNGKYRYAPSLKCGNSYETKTLVSQIRSNEQLVISGQGLYEMNGGYVFRGDAPNNYVKFSDRIWHIVKIQDDYVYLLARDALDYVSVWDDRYNVTRSDNSGINDYGVSRVRAYLDNLYAGDEYLKSSDKMLVVPYNLSIGKRDKNAAGTDGSIENSEILQNVYMGLLPIYDVMNASIDENCRTIEDSSCSNYNYLSYLRSSWWSATANSANTYQVYKTNGGYISTSPANTELKIRPVVRLVKDALYVSGNGTLENPYTIK